jgi:V/A-type H+/Na+-transporting ATPase subunit I
VFRPVPMAKAKIICLKDDADSAAGLLQRLGAVEVVRNTDSRLGPGRQHEALGEVSTFLLKLNSVLAILGWDGKPEPANAGSAQELIDACGRERGLMSAAETLSRNLADGRKKAKELEAAEEFAGTLGGMSFDPRLLSTESLAFFFGRMPTHNILEFRESLHHITDSFDFRHAKANRVESVCLLAVDRRSAQQVEARLAASDFRRLTEADLSTGVAAGFMELEARLQRLRAEQAGLQEHRKRLAAENGARIAGLRDLLEAEKARLEVQARFGATRDAYAIEGWVVEADFGRLEKAVSEGLGGRAVVQRIRSEEEPPTLSSVPASMKPFSDFVEFISVPNSREIDPTLFFALGFPVFYGMMLGDVGYGFVSLLAGLAVALRFRGALKSIGMVWAYAATSSIVFGILYDEYFGFPHQALLGFSLYHTLLGRLDNLELLLAVAVAMGAVHIALGLSLGFADGWMRGERRRALGKAGWMGIEAVLAALAAYYLFHLGEPPGFLAGLALASLALIYRAEGYLGLMELPSIASNIMSYTRIVAIGVSSLAIAGILNNLLSPAGHQGIWAALLLPVFVIGHLGNIVLGMFESMIQAARLNYVEFFPKFFTGGGRRFRPFRLEKDYLLQGGV